MHTESSVGCLNSIFEYYSIILNRILCSTHSSTTYDIPVVHQYFEIFLATGHTVEKELYFEKDVTKILTSLFCKYM